MANRRRYLKEYHDRFKAWKPIHLCWWFEKHGLPIPPYLIGGAAVVVQQEFRFRNDDGSEADATFMGDANGEDQTIAVDTKFRIRFVVEETDGGNGSPEATLYYSHNSGSYTPVTSSSDVARAVASDYDPDPSDDQELTTARLGYSGTYANGRFDSDGNAATSVTIDADGAGYTEFEFCLTIPSGTVSNNDTIDLEVYDKTGALDSYSDIPRITVEVGESTVSTTAAGKSWLQDRTSVIKAAQAWLQDRVSTTAAGQAFLQQVASATAAGQAVLKEAYSKTAAFNAWLQDRTDAAAAFTAHLQDRILNTAAGQAFLQMTASATAAGQAVLQEVVGATAAFGAYLVDVAADKTAAMQAVLKEAYTKSAAQASFLQDRITASAAGQAMLQMVASATAAGQAFLQMTASATAAGQAVLKEAYSKTAAMGAYLQDIGAVTVTAAMQAVLSEAYSATSAIRAVLKEVYTKAAAAGAWLQDCISDAASGQAWLQDRETATTALQCYLKAAAAAVSESDMEALGRSFTTAAGLRGFSMEAIDRD